MNGLYNLVGAVGKLFCLKLGGYFFDEYGSYSPMILVGVGNILVIFISIILILFGKFSKEGQ